MHPLVNLIESTITRYRLLSHDSRTVVVALSGGADSVALLSALNELGYTCVGAHCNFHLRGEESDRDMHLCQALCDKLGISLSVHDCDVASRRKATGESVEMACRTLRYEWFDSLLCDLRAQAIAVAHHSQDNEETFLLNLLRGSSLTGLTGMRHMNGNVVRPMLNAPREMIDDYIAERGLPYVVDSSNLTDDYLRNRLRHLVLPAMRKARCDADRGILATIDFLSQNRDFYEQQMARLASIYRHDDDINLRAMIDAEPHARLILFEMLRPIGFNMTHVDNILAAAGESGRFFTACGYRLELSHGILRIIYAPDIDELPDEVEVSLQSDILTPLHITISEHHISEFHPERNPNIAYFDSGILSDHHTFTIRPWRHGDRLQPFGMNATRLLSDVMSDAHLHPDRKRALRLLTCDGTILWAVGLRAAAHFPVTAQTTKYLRLEYKEDSGLKEN